MGQGVTTWDNIPKESRNLDKTFCPRLKLEQKPKYLSCWELVHELAQEEKGGGRNKRKRKEREREIRRVRERKKKREMKRERKKSSGA